MRIRAKWLLCGLFAMTGLATADDPKTETPAAAKEVEAGDLKLTVPPTWKQQQPSNNLRLAQFSIPATEGDTDPAELVISPPIGGSREDNITRWVNQFEAGGRELVMSQGKCAQGEYVLVQLSGTYKRPIGPPIRGKTEAVADYKMHGVMLTVMKDGKNVGNYFLKLTGPAKTVAANEEALRASIAADKAKEEKYELP
jgi:hypothetical protein